MVEAFLAFVNKTAGKFSKSLSHLLDQDVKSGYREVIDLDNDGIPSGSTRKSYARWRTNNAARLLRAWPLYSVCVTILAIFLFFRGSSQTEDINRTSPALDIVSQAYHDYLPLRTDGGRPAPRKTVVFGSKLPADVTWTNKLPSDWDLRYAQDGASGSHNGTALSYLNWIIDNYRSNLPAYVVFAHGELVSWHQPSPLPDLLRAVNLTAIDKHRWLSLRCTLRPSCTPGSTWVHTDRTPPGDDWLSYLVRGVYSHIYRPEDKWSPKHDPTNTADIAIPPVIAAPAGSQFVVSRAALWTKPLDFWKRVREPLLMTTQEMEPWWPGGKSFSPQQLDIAYERLWHYFFLMTPIVCIDEDYCSGSVFQGHIKCERGAALTAESTQQEIAGAGCRYRR